MQINMYVIIISVYRLGQWKIKLYIYNNICSLISIISYLSLELWIRKMISQLMENNVNLI